MAALTLKRACTCLRIGVIGNANFLVDTGTDTAILHPFDAGNLHRPFDELSNPLVATSAGGQHTYYAEPAVVSFYDGETRPDFRTNPIGKPHPVTDALDSLLGRDILNEFEMEYAPRRGQFSFHLDDER